MAPPPALLYRGTTYHLSRPVFVVGSHEACDLVLEDPGVAPMHLALLTGASGQVYVVPLCPNEADLEVSGSAAQRAELTSDATLEVGDARLRFRYGVAERPIERAPDPERWNLERDRLWRIWADLEAPKGTHLGDPSAWNLLDYRAWIQAAWALVTRDDFGTIEGLQAGLQAALQPVQVKTLRARAAAEETEWVPVDFSLSNPSVPFMRMMRRVAERSESVTSSDLFSDPRFVASGCMEIRNVRSGFGVPVRGRGGERAVLGGFRRVQEDPFTPAECRLAEALVRLTENRLGASTRPWRAPAPPGVSFAIECLEHSWRTPLQPDMTLVGRDPRTCDVLVSAEDCSRRHAAILRGLGGRTFLVDLGSKYGTFVGDKLVVAEEVFDGDTIKLGTAPFRLHLDHLAAPLLGEARALCDDLFELLAQLVSRAPPDRWLAPLSRLFAGKVLAIYGPPGGDAEARRLAGGYPELGERMPPELFAEARFGKTPVAGMGAQDWRVLSLGSPARPLGYLVIEEGPTREAADAVREQLVVKTLNAGLELR